MPRNDDFPSARQVSGYGIRYGLAILLVLAVLGAVGFIWKIVTAPVRTVGGVIERVADPDHALQSYRWFHNSHQEILAKQAQIGLAKQALEAAVVDRKEARRVELIGLQQGCQRLIGEYNARATRADTVIFKHPERFLPGDWPGDRNPLPETVNMVVCS